VIKNETKIVTFLKESDIAEYQREFALIFRNKPHILDDKEQKVLSTMGIINGGFATIFSTLNDTEVKFQDALDSKGKKIPLTTIADVTRNLKSKDRSLRKTTWTNFNKAYSNYENTFTQTLYYNYLMLNTASKIHKFEDYVSATAFEDEVNVDLILNLYKYAELFKSSSLRYRQIFETLLKKQLKLTKLEP
jgi:oligoendopeptidase F